jgi:hypothetical protein
MIISKVERMMGMNPYLRRYIEYQASAIQVEALSDKIQAERDHTSRSHQSVVVRSKTGVSCLHKGGLWDV